MIASLEKLTKLSAELAAVRPDLDGRYALTFEANEILLIRRLVDEYLIESEEVISTEQLRRDGNLSVAG